MTPEPDNNRSRANYRYYCDNDLRYSDSNGRWRLREDPRLENPDDYVPERQRPMPHQGQSGIATQEWYDKDNWM